MDLTVDAGSKTPPYAQVRDQVATLILAGELADQARLPAIRALASSLSLAANTVAKAYAELEEAGLVVTAGRNGTRVIGQTVDAELASAADALIALGKAKGLETEALIALLRTRLRE
ncbi:GntR family transcriptional regulator [Demequina salsinemoris]|uniref:GntR family transcriptional regulator n=1 Tax=Demequina salsinemoris TaxID=577470 RepID=UPI0007827CED|nr:GntR family transcriptional regulator [Demequina salsinemoris]